MVETTYRNNFNVTSTWLSSQCLPSGAILYSATEIDPYFANYAAIGMTRDPNRTAQVLAWIKWYVAHLNWPDQWHLYGTTYNYSVAGSVETSTGACDSTDSCASTFLTLLWNAWQTGNAEVQAYIRTLYAPYDLLDILGGVLILTQHSDGLTWAKPDYQIKDLMDNCEGYRGLSDLASLYQALGDIVHVAKYSAAAASMLKGVMGMFEESTNTWATNKNDVGVLQAASLANWYPAAAAQIFPVLMGVVTTQSGGAETLQGAQCGMAGLG
jgi:hypothetical protein